MIQNDQCQIISLSVNAGTVYSMYTGLFSPNGIICPYTVANGFVPYWNHPNTCRCVKDRYCKKYLYMHVLNKKYQQQYSV